MVKKSDDGWERKVLDNQWVYFLAAVVFLAIAYGFISLAINYGSIWQYALAIIFLIWAFKEIKRGVQGLIHK